MARTRRAWLRLVTDEDTLLGEWQVSLGPGDEEHFDVADAADRVTLLDAIETEFRAFDDPDSHDVDRR